MDARSLKLAVTILLAAVAPACSAEQPVPASAPIPTEPGPYPYPVLPPDTQRATEPAHLIGNWRTGEPGQPVMHVTIDRQRIVASWDCLTKAWTYRFEGSQLIVSPSPIISCQRMPTPLEAEGFDKIARAERAYHRSGRGLILEGSGSRLVLIAR